MRGEDGRIACVRYMLPRHKAANWVGPGRGRTSTRPGANGVVDLSPFEFLDRLTDLVPPPRKHRHSYHGVFAPNHKLRSAVTAHDKRECRQAARGRDRSACGQRTCGGRRCHRRLLRLMRQTALPRHLPDCVGETDGPRGGGVSFCVPGVRGRHPTQRRRPAGAGSREVRGSQAGEGQDGFARVKSAPDTSRRSARTTARLAGPRGERFQGGLEPTKKSGLERG